jgi:hypothetical protein
MRGILDKTERCGNVSDPSSQSDDTGECCACKEENVRKSRFLAIFAYYSFSKARKTGWRRLRPRQSPCLCPSGGKNHGLGIISANFMVDQYAVKRIW